MPSTLPRWLKFTLPFIGLVFFIFLVYTLNLQTIIDAFLSIDPRFIVIALLLTVPILIMRIYAWQWICRAQNIEIPTPRLTKIYLIGLFYGIGTPGYVGQLMRVPYMKETTSQPYGKLFVNVVLETYLHSFSLYIMMVIGAIAIVGLLPQVLWATLVWAGVALALFLFLAEKKRGEWLFQRLVRFFLPKKIRGQASSFTDTFYHDFPKMRVLSVPIVVGALTWVLMLTQEYMIVLGLHLPIPYLYFLVLFPIANTAGFLPISIAGLGTREATAILLFTTLFGVAAADVFVVSLMGLVVTDGVLSLLGFFLSFTEARRKLSEAVPGV
jgi:glycosyltransferase 2 family protein